MSDEPKKSIGCVGWFVLIILFFWGLSFFENLFGGGGSGTSATANTGYMTLQNDKLLTTIEIKKGGGESISQSEQNLLDAAKAGKLGKPYEDRPDKDHDGGGTP
jgi:hypothetical protein